MTAPRLLSLLAGAFTDRFRSIAADPLSPARPAPMLPPPLNRAAENHLVISRRFPASPSQVRHTRAFVAEILGDGHPCFDETILLTSELATNAVEHPTGPTGRPREFLLTVTLLPHGVLITVQDPGSLTIPCPRDPDADATGGRGLALVNTLATRWGFHRDPHGTVIWFELT
ncbi:ATP-binding protein [Streptosporangium sp. NPDC087985]|uniref:ATP-binding protein n=1 Tax=Streptosporangium sp. NPDC087985 TaxID=3366196 RepID=UPI0037F6A886